MADVQRIEPPLSDAWGPCPVGGGREAVGVVLGEPR